MSSLPRVLAILLSFGGVAASHSRTRASVDADRLARGAGRTKVAGASTRGALGAYPARGSLLLRTWAWPNPAAVENCTIWSFDVKSALATPLVSFPRNSQQGEYTGDSVSTGDGTWITIAMRDSEFSEVGAVLEEFDEATGTLVASVNTTHYCTALFFRPSAPGSVGCWTASPWFYPPSPPNPPGEDLTASLLFLDRATGNATYVASYPVGWVLQTNAAVSYNSVSDELSLFMHLGLTGRAQWWTVDAATGALVSAIDVDHTLTWFSSDFDAAHNRTIGYAFEAPAPGVYTERLATVITPNGTVSLYLSDSDVYPELAEPTGATTIGADGVHYSVWEDDEFGMYIVGKAMETGHTILTVPVGAQLCAADLSPCVVADLQWVDRAA